MKTQTLNVLTSPTPKGTDNGWNVKVTQLKGDLSPNKCIELKKIADWIKDGKEAKHVNELREMLPYCTPPARPVATERIPVILFASQYKEKEWVCYNGLVLLEFNNLLSSEEAAQLRNQIGYYLQPLVAFIGASGKSVKVVVRYTLPDGSLPQTEKEALCFHALAYRRAVIHYQAQLQREVSFREPTLDRGCRLSSDSSCYYNPECRPILLPQPLEMPGEPGYREQRLQSANPLERILPGMEQYQKMEMLFEICLQAATEQAGGIPEHGDEKNFLVDVARRCFDSGIPEEDTTRWFHFRAFTEEPLLLVRATVHNVYQQKKAPGSKPCLPAPTNLVARMEEFLKRRYEFRHNEIRGEVEYREHHSFCFRFRPVNEEILNSICLNAQEEGLDLWDKDIRRYIYSSRIPKHHPVREFLAQLPAWDGKERIRQLADTVPTSDPVWRERFYIWFLSMVAHWYKVDSLYANSLVPILVGGQGLSKSVFFRLLLPPALQEYHIESINLENKTEAEILMAQNVLITLDEFDRFSRKYQADLKHLIQKPILKIRRPHQKTFQSMQRLASFSATANPMDLLNDPTGSRRYICVELTGPIDLSHPIEYDQLYAQALHAIRSGERYWMNTDEEKQLNQSNIDFQQQPLELQYLFSYFRLPAPGEEGEKYSAIELLDYISTRSKRKFSNTSSYAFGRILNHAGIRKVHTTQGNVYYLIKK